MLNLPACLSVKFLPGAERINQPYRLAGQQPDNLCGPYWVSMLLQAHGVTGVDVMQLALLASTSIFGWDGYHLQPQDAIASALRRDDGKEGGVFLFVAAENQAEVEQQAREQSFDIASWDNGTPVRCDGQSQSS